MLLVERGLVETRTKAQALILAGKVFCRDQRIDKPGTSLPSDAEVSIAAADRYVSRGGYKLEGALQQLQVDPTALICVDVGASTGGFTDCLLQHGASRVYAVDVGHGLLAHKLLQDARVVVRERTNARFLQASDFPEPIELIVADASFIGIEKLSAGFARVLAPGRTLLAMIKPQFEAGREAARKARGVITDPEVRAQAISSARDAIERSGFSVINCCDSLLPGPRGNVEHFVLAVRQSDATQNTSTQTS